MTVRGKCISSVRLTGFILLFLLFFVPVSRVSAYTAEEIYCNDDTGYDAVILDQAELISTTDEYYEQMTEEMRKITAYGNVAFVSTEDNPGTTREFAKRTAYELFGKESATLFLIDMDNREIYIYSYGAILRTVTQSRAFIITDNIYRYATGARYDECAYQAFVQENKLLEGRRIAQPMKYISSILLALMFAGVIVYEDARRRTSVDTVGTEDLIRHTDFRLGVENITIKNKKKHRIDHQREREAMHTAGSVLGFILDNIPDGGSSSSHSSGSSSHHSSGGGGGSSHSSGGGGGYSGGGGGHKF